MDIICSCLKINWRFFIRVVKNVICVGLLFEGIVVDNFLIKDLCVVFVGLLWVGEFSFRINLDV